MDSSLARAIALQGILQRGATMSARDELISTGCRAVWVFWTWPVAVEVLERRASGLDDGCRNVAQLLIAALG